MQKCYSTNNSNVGSLRDRHGDLRYRYGTMESDNCREMSRDDRDANSVLVITQERARFSCKDRQKFIDPFTQSISGLC